ncbi:hypothetical protein PMIN06_010696 [Paraphaeosphaeria minitans]
MIAPLDSGNDYTDFFKQDTELANCSTRGRSRAAAAHSLVSKVCPMKSADQATPKLDCIAVSTVPRAEHVGGVEADATGKICLRTAAISRRLP